MGNLFDTMRDSAFDRVAHTMGYTAIWTPASGGEAQSAEVLFKDDTEAYELEGDKYDPAMARMEYRHPVFAALKGWVDAGSKETVTIIFDEGIVDYWVQKVDTIFDGRTKVAYLLSKSDGGDYNADYNNNFNRVP